MTIDIAEVRSTADLSTFIALPRRLYRGMAGFTPPLDHERRLMLDPAKAPFFTHGEACYWIARKDGRPVGRISAQIDRLATAPPLAEAGLFGCLDAIDDPAVVAALLAQAEQWIAARGRCSAVGPFTLSINGESGLLVDGHQAAPMLMMPWHPPYLEGLLSASGYGRVQTLLSFVLAKQQIAEPEWRRRFERPRLPEVLRLRGLDMAHLDREVDVLRRLFNDAWSANWGFTPLAEADLAALRAGFRPVLQADMAVIAELAGVPVGFVLVLPNVVELTADLGGAPSPLGWARLVWRMLRRRFRSARIILMGLSKDHQATMTGAVVVAAMLSTLLQHQARHGLAVIEAGWVLHDNKPMLDIVGAFGFRQCRVYGVFAKPLSL